MEAHAYKLHEDDSILHRLKSSLDHVWSVRKRSADPPNRIEIQMSSSYILKDRSLDYKPSLTVIPEVHEDLTTQPDQPKPYSKFSTKIEFIKPKQRTSEDSPTSVKSGSSEESCSPGKQILELTPEPTLLKQKFKYPNLESIKATPPPAPAPVPVPNPKSNPQPHPTSTSISTPIPKPKAVLPHQIQPSKPSQPNPMILKAKEEISNLHKNKANLIKKIELLSNSLSQIEDLSKMQASAPSNNEMSAHLLSQLEKLEHQQLAPESDSRLPEAVMKVQNLESEIKNLKSLKDSTVIGYEQELKVINHKLKDLQECNEILTEILACFRKEPLLVESQMSKSPNMSPSVNQDLRDLNNLNDLKDLEDLKGLKGLKGLKDSKEFDDKMMATIKLNELVDSQSILEDAYKKRDQIMRNKEKLETEYREIPSNSKSLTSKKRKLSLEYELSLNYSQLVAVNNKIKKYSTEA